MVLVPSADIRQMPLMSRNTSLFAIEVSEASKWRLSGLIALLLALLVTTNLAQYLWHRSRSR
ncbi:Yop proteins translocation lipoprotein J precursor [compost metagenome]